MEDRELARKTETPSAAVSAVMGIAKLHGLLVDKSKAEFDVNKHEEVQREAEEFTRSIMQLSHRLRERGEAGESFRHVRPPERIRRSLCIYSEIAESQLAGAWRHGHCPCGETSAARVPEDHCQPSAEKFRS
jgi:hypothetical protein